MGKDVRVNNLFYSKGFQAFINTISFLFMMCCFALTILLPLPYKQEAPGGISLEPDPLLAPPIIALCVVVPFLSGVIFLLIYKITYKKTKMEVLKEFGENVEFDFISNETKHKWELDIEGHVMDRKIRRAELELDKKLKYIELKQKEQEVEIRIEEMVKGVKRETTNEEPKEEDNV